ncbi:hypothetical protein GOBAR_AA29760 [Gossypium barbadense]|uniref:Uncharacterized protein n=1 Tax=Gossypium barbadense TaxID=3634 RepID=A0A2P5WIM2_GOSBA|nr:hypothetical protein GOBAR_AA29760 [Gossypium barbadense]
MLNDKVKHKEIDLYVEHEINIVVFLDDDLLLTIATVKGSSDGNQSGEGLNGEGVEVVGSKSAEVDAASGKGGEGLTREGVEVAGNKGGDGGKYGEGFERLNGEGVEGVGTKGGESFEGLNGEGVKVASNKGGEGGEVEGGEGGEDFKCLNEEGVEVGDGGLNSGVEEANDEGYEDESDSGLEDDYDYLMKAMYFSDGDNDEEFQEASQKWKEVEGKTSRKTKEKIVDETKSKSSRNDDHGSILKSNDYDNTDACRRSRFPTSIQTQ